MYRYTYIYLYLYTYPSPLSLKGPPFLPGNARNVAVGPCEVPGGDRSGGCGSVGRVFFVRFTPGLVSLGIQSPSENGNGT